MTLTRPLAALAFLVLAACRPALAQPEPPTGTGSPRTPLPLASAGDPDPTHCLITVDGTVHLDAPCPVDDSDPGTVTLNTGTETVPRVFVYLNTYEGVTEAFWNGGEGAAHAQAPLGAVTLSGRCWTSDRARICRPA